MFEQKFLNLFEYLAFGYNEANAKNIDIFGY